MRVEHPWDVSAREAIDIQKQLAAHQPGPPPRTPIHTIAGVDVDVHRGVSYAAVGLMTFPELEVLSVALARRRITFPYRPGLLAFREGPAVLEAFGQLPQLPDVAIFDGHGFAHPRRMGLARHIGLWLDLPTIGCAKSCLIGRHDMPRPEKGSYTPLLQDGDVIGAVVRTRSGVRPVYVSAGHRMELNLAIQTILTCCTRYRLPEPIRLAHQAAGAAHA
jgi:deoxyribonuclease V